MPVVSPTIDAETNMAFLNYSLEAKDPIIHKPIVSYTWSRDIQIRSLALSDEYTSFVKSNFGAAGTIAQGTIPWISQNSTSIPAISLTSEKFMTPVRLAGQLISYTSIELEKAQKEGIPLDSLQLEALRNTYQLGIDQMVYVGDSTVDTSEHKCRGLLNSDYISKSDSPDKFINLSGDEIVAQINGLIQKVWAQTGYTLLPNVILLPPLVYAQLYNTKYSDNADVTLMTYIQKNCLGGTSISFRPVHWAATAASDGSGRIMAYINDKSRIRFNMAPIRGKGNQTDGLYFKKIYVWALGEVEFIYPECAAYLDKVCDAPSGLASYSNTVKTMSATKTMSDTKTMSATKTMSDIKTTSKASA